MGDFMKEKLFIIIPAFNEEKTIGKLLVKLKSAGYKNIIVIDDCSQDKTGEVAEKVGAVVLRHIINRGVGGAWRTGFAYALKQDAEIIITMDADLQHRVENIPNLVKPILNKKAEVVIGRRKFSSKKMPFSRELANRIGNLFTYLVSGHIMADSQSGFRCFSLKALKKMKFSSNKMEICSEMISEIKKNKLKLVEVPISTVYTKYSLSKGQSFKQGIKTLIRLIAVRFK